MQLFIPVVHFPYTNIILLTFPENFVLYFAFDIKISYLRLKVV